MKSFLAVVAFLALACVCVSAQSVVLPTRPAPPSHGRFAHVASEAPLARSARGAAGATGEAAPRRFAHTMVLDLAGQDVTAQHAAALGQTEAEAAAWADVHTPRGLSLLRYDVELRAHARILDEDINVLAVQCGQQGQALTLALTVADAQQALSTYTQGVVVQGSAMWACKNPNPAEAENTGDDWTILVSVESVSQVDDHTLQLVGSQSSYPDLFGNAEVLLRQPSLQPQAGQDVPRSPAGRHALALEQPLSVGVQTEEDATMAAAASVLRQEQPARHAVHMLNNELQFSAPGMYQLYEQGSSVRVTFTGYSKIKSWATRTKIKLLQFMTQDRPQVVAPPPCEQPQASADSCTFLMPLSAFGTVKPSIKPYHFDITYCKDGLIPGTEQCSTSSTAMFWLPLVATDKFTGNIPTLEKSCTSLQCSSPTAVAAFDLGDRALCKLCDQGRDFSLSVGCVDCSVSYTAQVSVFSFASSIAPLDLYVKAETVVDVLLDANLDVRAKLQLKAAASGSLQVINALPIPPSWSIPLGRLTIAIGAWFDMFAGYSAAFDASATARATAEVSNVLTARASFNTKDDPDASLTGTLPPFVFTKQPTVAIEASGQGQLELFLRPVVTVGIEHFVKATATADVYVTLASLFSWPAFPAIAPPAIYDVDPNKPAFAHKGDCSRPHQMRYNVVAGIRSARVSARLVQDIGSSINVVLQQFDVKKDLGSYDFPSFSLPLVSGCLLNQASSEPVIFTFTIPPTRSRNASLSLDLPNFVDNVVLDIASALRQPSTRFAIALFDKVGNLLDDEGNVAMVKELVALGKPFIPQLPALPPILDQVPIRDPNVIQSSESSGNVPVGAAAEAPPVRGGEAASVRVSLMDSDDPAAPSALELQGQMRAQMASPYSPLRHGAATRSLDYVHADSSPSPVSHVGFIVGVSIGALLAVSLAAGFAYYMLVWRKKHPSGGASAEQRTSINMGALDSSASAVQLQSVAAVDVEVVVAPAGSPQPSPVYNEMGPSPSPPPPPRI